MKVMTIFGTRPEAIKMSPVIKELENAEGITSVVCVTGQHKEMLDQVLKAFNITPTYNLGIMRSGQSLFDVTENILKKINIVLKDEQPDIVLVHGDTTTTFVTSLACYYLQIPVGHVEAGLRTNNIYSPFPEEFNRQAVSLISKFHFAPTQAAKDNLIAEGKSDSGIYITGNTAIDALKTTVSESYNHEYLDWVEDDRLIILTAHRRENLGAPLESIFTAAKEIVDKYSDVKIICPVHLNPKVQNVANRIMGSHSKIKLISPLDVLDFHNFLAKSHFIMSDSGGVQEEAPSLGKPVLVLRDTTERPEGVKAGTLKLIGNNKDTIIEEASKLLDDEYYYKKMSEAKNPYGDGKASKRIVETLNKNIL